MSHSTNFHKGFLFFYSVFGLLIALIIETKSFIMYYFKECWERAKECLILLPFIILPLLCWGVAKGSEIREDQLPDTVAVQVSLPTEEIVVENVEKESRFIIIRRGTVYNPEPEQGWGDPWQAAGGRIDSLKLANGQLRWCALSPDLLEKIPMHSKIKVHDPDKKIQGIWYVKDVCGIKSTIDFLHPSSIRTGLWNDIKVEVLREGK